VKKLLWVLVTVVVLLGTVSAPIRLHADGNPLCPNQKSGCKPLDTGMMLQ
jgi:hypothetical protein